MSTITVLTPLTRRLAIAIEENNLSVNDLFLVFGHLIGVDVFTISYSDKMSAILTTGSPWTFIHPNNLEDFKIPRCADQFIRLLDAIRDWYCNLPQPGHQLQFLNLQLELIESFRRRLMQLHNSPIDNATSIMAPNANNCMNSEWGKCSKHYTTKL